MRTTAQVLGRPGPRRISRHTASIQPVHPVLALQWRFGNNAAAGQSDCIGRRNVQRANSIGTGAISIGTRGPAGGIDQRYRVPI